MIAGEVSDEHATTYVFNRKQTRCGCVGIGSRVQPFGSQQIVGGSGVRAATLGTAAEPGASWRNPTEQGANACTAEDPGTGGEDQSPRAREGQIKKGYRALDDGRDRAYALIDPLRAHEPVDQVCAMFDVPRSCYYAHRRRRDHIDVDRMRLRGCVHEIFIQSRQAAGSRTVRDMLQESGIEIVRFKVRHLMRELGLISKQPGPPAYKQTKVEQPDIPNQLNRGFTVYAPSHIYTS